MTINVVAKFLYRSSNIDEKYFEKILKKPLPFANCEYEFRISGTVDTDIRIMSFVDTFWGFEVTGGSDQFEPLIIIDVKRTGLAYRAGIRINDIITRINNVYTDDMTLREAQRLIRKSGRYVQIFVLGDPKIEKCTEYTVDFWFKPPHRFPPIHVENKWTGGFPWNDRHKPIYRESNCFMVPSKAEAKNVERNQNRKEPIQVTESDDNETVTYIDANAANDANGANGHTNGQTTVSNGTTNGTSTTNGNNSTDSQHEQNDETTK